MQGLKSLAAQGATPTNRGWIEHATSDGVTSGRTHDAWLSARLKTDQLVRQIFRPARAGRWCNIPATVLRVPLRPEVEDNFEMCWRNLSVMGVSRPAGPDPTTPHEIPEEYPGLPQGGVILCRVSPVGPGRVCLPVGRNSGPLPAATASRLAHAYL